MMNASATAADQRGATGSILDRFSAPLRTPIAHVPPAANDRGASDCEVLIVGGGPVGLLLANLLGARGVRTILAEKRTRPPHQSMAIGITPPSLEILKRVGLDATFCREGLPIRRAHVHESGTPLGQVEFDRLPTEFRFILSLPQSRTVQVLQENLGRFPNVTRLGGMEFRGLGQDLDGVDVRFLDHATGIENEIRAGYVVGCDGHRSRVRAAIATRVHEKEYAPRFVMADFEDRTGLGDEAHLFFTARASIESFPLPGNQRRWIVLATEEAERDPDRYLVETVRTLTGFDLADCPRYFQSSFRTRRMLARHFFHGRVVLCGDAAHLMSPIGGQGMNTGFADAELLAEIVVQVREQPTLAPEKFELYERLRRRAFKVAANRAARGMWLGTRRGRVASAARKHFIRDVLFRPSIKSTLAPYFAMLTVPFNTAARVPLRWKAA